MPLYEAALDAVAMRLKAAFSAFVRMRKPYLLIVATDHMIALRSACPRKSVSV